MIDPTTPQMPLQAYRLAETAPGATQCAALDARTAQSAGRPLRAFRGPRAASAQAAQLRRICGRSLLGQPDGDVSKIGRPFSATHGAKGDFANAIKVSDGAVSWQSKRSQVIAAGEIAHGSVSGGIDLGSPMGGDGCVDLLLGGRHVVSLGVQRVGALDVGQGVAELALDGDHDIGRHLGAGINQALDLAIPHGFAGGQNISSPAIGKTRLLGFDGRQASALCANFGLAVALAAVVCYAVDLRLFVHFVSSVEASTALSMGCIMRHHVALSTGKAENISIATDNALGKHYERRRPMATTRRAQSNRDAGQHIRRADAAHHQTALAGRSHERAACAVRAVGGEVSRGAT